MKEKNEYYGIYLNDDIPKLDKKNKYDREVAIKFEGRAYLIEKKENDKLEKIEIENEHKLKKEGDYEIEFINLQNEMYHLQVKIKSSFLLLLFLLFIFGAIIAFLLCNPAWKEKSPLTQMFDSINLSVLPLNIGKNEKAEESSEIDTNQERKKLLRTNKSQNENETFENEYHFEVSLKKQSSQEINLFQTMSAQSLAKRKISPGDSGSFAIVMSTQKSKVDMEYQVEFQDLNHEKPTHMIFQIRDDSRIYATLQELAQNLKGKINKQSQKRIVIDWQWAYETGENEKEITENDKIDTAEGEKLNGYQFKIMVTGKESV